MNKKDHLLKTAALAYWNHKFFDSKEYEDIMDECDFDTAIKRADEIRNKLATKYGVSSEDMLGYLNDNPQPIKWFNGIGNRNDGD